jgi:hypothetical protein
MTARLDDAGNLMYLRNPLWNADLGWTTIAAGVKNTVLLFYHASSAQGATGTLDANGNYVHLMLHTGFSPGRTQKPVAQSKVKTPIKPDVCSPIEAYDCAAGAAGSLAI